MLHLTTAQFVCLLAAVVCHGNFFWAAALYFGKPEGLPTGMKWIAATGLFFMLGHLAGCALDPSLSAWRTWLAALAYSGAGGLFWTSLREAGRERLSIAFTPNEPVRLLTTGPYRYLRHPIYTSYIVAWLAGGLAIEAWWSWFAVALMTPQYLVAIRLEEQQYATSGLSAEYKQYRKVTPAVFPVFSKNLSTMLFRVRSWPKD